MQGFFDFTEQTEIVKHKRHKTLWTPKHDWRAAPLPKNLKNITVIAWGGVSVERIVRAERLF